MREKRVYLKQNMSKQLNCLYRIAELIEKPDTCIDDILSNFVEIIPGAMQFPEQTYVRLSILDKTYKTEFTGSARKALRHQIKIDEKKIGCLTVCIDVKLSGKENAFTDEDTGLIYYLCERIGRVVQRHLLSAEVSSIKQKLEIQNMMLKEKNTALSVILNHLEEEKCREKKKFIYNIESMALPLLDKMKSSPDPFIYIEILEQTLKDLTTDFGIKMKQKTSMLSPKEIEICNLIRQGKTSKEIGDILFISSKTVNKHRDNIRKKLGLKNKSHNLTTFLNNMDVQRE